MKDSEILWNETIYSIDKLTNKETSVGTLLTEEEIDSILEIRKHLAQIAYRLQKREGM